jgi:hypothetical protein
LLQAWRDEKLKGSTPHVVSSDAEPRSASEMSFLQLVNNLLQGRSNETTDSLLSFIDDQEDSLKEHSFLQCHPPIEVLTPSSFPTIEYAWMLIHAFNKLVNAFLFIISKTDTEVLVQIVYNDLQSASRTAICQLCMIFALGDQALSQKTRSSSIFWFDNGRRYLDETLDESEDTALWTFRVYLMMAIYYISRRRNASTQYIGTYYP